MSFVFLCDLLVFSIADDGQIYLTLRREIFSVMHEGILVLLVSRPRPVEYFYHSFGSMFLSKCNSKDAVIGTARVDCRGFPKQS